MGQRVHLWNRLQKLSTSWRKNTRLLSQPTPEILIKGTPESVPESLYAELTGEYIRNLALKCSGGARPGGLNAQGAKGILCSESFGNRCYDLCGALARFTRKLATTNTESATILAFLSCRMIGLDKNPGIRPVEIGETFRRIVTAALIQNFRGETQNATGPIQTCGGARSEVEAAVHTMSGIFKDSTMECVIFVDADNAFNRQAALHNISFICPEVSTFLNNVYKSPTPYYIKQHVIVSRERTTQGDVAAMEMYSIATKPMVYEDETNTNKSFYADDGVGAGTRYMKRYMNGGHPSWCWNRSTDIFRMPAKQYFLSNWSTINGPFKSLQGLVSMWLQMQPSI